MRLVVYSGGSNSLVRSMVTSGIRSGSGTSQSMQRNLRPPVLTSIKCISLLHFEHAGGGGFLGMVVSNSGAVVALSRSIGLPDGSTSAP